MSKIYASLLAAMVLTWVGLVVYLTLTWPRCADNQIIILDNLRGWACVVGHR